VDEGLRRIVDVALGVGFDYGVEFGARGVTSSAHPRANRLLGAASPWGLSDLESPLEVRAMQAGERLCAVQEPTGELQFPTAGLVALLALAPDGRSVARR